MKTLYVFLTFIMSTLLTTLQAQEPGNSRRVEADRQFQQTLALVQTNRFMIKIDRVYPQNGMDMSRFNPQGSITVNDSIAQGTLPFFGRAYNLAYGDDGGIEFNSRVKEREIKINNKKKHPFIGYRFNVAGKNDNYQFFIEITGSGACTVNLSSNKRATISYSGLISQLKEEPAKP